MGCDIHCYVEYKNAKYQYAEAGEELIWFPFGGSLNPGRNYYAFAALADVRNYDGKVKTPFPPRGYPKDAAYQAKCDNFLAVVADEQPEDGCTNVQRAAAWVKSGSSYYYDEKQRYVSHPDWHSHSWLTAQELRKVIDSIGGAEFCSANPAWGAMLAATEYLATLGQARVVFWFDN